MKIKGEKQMPFGSANVLPINVKRNLLLGQHFTALQCGDFANHVKVFPQQSPKWVEQWTVKN